MPRDTRQKTLRQDAPLSPNKAAPALEQQRRFFQASGSGGGVREARALADAFGVGVKFAEGAIDRSNVKGAERAQFEAASGGTRLDDEKNAGYNRAWDELDAENDLNFAMKELPEMLKGFDAENKSEEEVQEFISSYMEEQFKGINPDSHYTKMLAPGLLKLEADAIAVHRDTVMDKINTENRTKIYENAQARFEQTGEIPYDYLAEQTNVFFEGKDKKLVYWETLRDMAIETGDSSVISESPERFANGDPTGKNDPNMIAEIRSWEREADVVGARREAAAAAELKVANEDALFDSQIALVNAIETGEDTSEYLLAIRSNPEGGFADVTASVNFGQAQQTRAESRSGNDHAVANVLALAYSGDVSVADVFEAYNAGVFGVGKQAITAMKPALAAARSAQQTSRSGNKGDITVWQSQLNRDFPTGGNPLLGTLDPTKSKINAGANGMYTTLVHEQGVDPQEAYMQVRERFEPVVKTSAAEGAKAALAGESQSDFIARTATPEVLQQAATSGPAARAVFGRMGVSSRARMVDSAVKAGTLSEEQAEQLLGYF